MPDCAVLRGVISADVVWFDVRPCRSIVVSVHGAEAHTGPSLSACSSCMSDAVSSVSSC